MADLFAHRDTTTPAPIGLRKVGLPAQDEITPAETAPDRPRFVYTTDELNAAFAKAKPVETPTPPLKDSRSVGEWVNDVATDTGAATLGFGKSVVDLFDPDSSLSKWIGEDIKKAKANQSEWRKGYRKQIEDEIKADEAAGGTGIVPMLKGYLFAPSTFAADVVGNLAPTIATALVGGPIAAGAVGFAAGAGGVRGGYYDRIMQAPDERLRQESPEYAKLRERLSEQSAKREIASDIDKRLGVSMAAGGAVEGIAKATGIEKLVAKGGVGGLKGALRTAGTEAATEGLSGGVQTFGENAAVQSRMPSESLSQGVARGAVQEGLMGAVGGAGFGAMGRRLPPDQAGQPEAPTDSQPLALPAPNGPQPSAAPGWTTPPSPAGAAQPGFPLTTIDTGPDDTGGGAIQPEQNNVTFLGSTPPTLIPQTITNNGKPFLLRGRALLEAERGGGEVVPVEGGYVVKRMVNAQARIGSSDARTDVAAGANPDVPQRLSGPEPGSVDSAGSIGADNNVAAMGRQPAAPDVPQDNQSDATADAARVSASVGTDSVTPIEGGQQRAETQTTPDLDIKAPTGKPVGAQPTGKLVEVYRGVMGQGMTENNARPAKNRKIKERPELDWRVEPMADNPDRFVVNGYSRVKTPEKLSQVDVAAHNAATSPFDSEGFDRKRNETIAKSRQAGNRHLDQIEPSVETMRGLKIYYAHDPKERGTVRTVSNTGGVVINWADKYSAEKNLAPEVKYGKSTVWQTWLTPSDLKDYVVDDGRKPVGSKSSAEADVAPVPRETSKPKPKPKTGKTRAELIAERKAKWKAENPFRAFIGEAGGVNIEHQKELTGETGRLGNRMLPYYGPYFRKAGLPLDSLVERAVEAGWLTQADVDSPTDTGGTRRLSDMITADFQNQPVERRTGKSDAEYEQEAQRLYDRFEPDDDLDVETELQFLADEVTASVDLDPESIFNEPGEGFTDEEIDQAFGYVPEGTYADEIRAAREVDETDAGPAPNRDDARGRPAGQDTEGFLTQPTEDGLRRQADQAERAAAEKSRRDSAPDADGFRLTGSDRAADVAEAAGQKPMFSLNRRQIESDEFKKWSNDAPLIQSEAAETHPFKTGEKIVVEAYHGTKRPDRVGEIFKRSRATSGPMAFFTSNPSLASTYAQGKQDTSLYNEETDYPNWFKFKPKGERSAVDIVSAWHRLSEEQRQKISALAPRVMFGEDQDPDGGNSIVLGPDGHKSGTGSYDYNLDQTRSQWNRRGNPLKALIEDWLNSGNLFNDEERFMTVLKLSGFPVNDVTFDSPHSEFPFVYKTFIAMQRPLVTGDIPVDVMNALERAAKSDRKQPEKYGADMWDKNTRSTREWVDRLKSPDGKYVWTSIPDKVTDVFKSLGYDGIVDYSGKGGGHSSPVYIPFSESQVKSAIGNKGKFDAGKKNILASLGQNPAPKGLKPSAVQSIVDRLTANWKNAPKITVIASVKDASPDVQAAYRERQSKGEVGSIEGYIDTDGTVYLVADALTNESDVRRVLFHEALGHYGLAGVYGKTLGEILDRVAIFQEARVRAKATDYGYDYSKKADRRRAAEEVLAEMAQRNPQAGLVKRAIAAIRQWLRDMGMDIALSDNDIIVQHILPAREFVQKGSGRLTDRKEPRFSQKMSSKFVSALEQALMKLNPKLSTMPGSQWAAWLNGNAAKLGIKADEIEWSGIKEYLTLRAKDKVTRDDLVGYLNDNGVRVTETVLGSRHDWRVRLDTLETRGRSNLSDAEKDEMDNLRDRFDREGSDPVDDGQQTKFGQYTLPGGTNYREVLVTLAEPAAKTVQGRQAIFDRWKDRVNAAFQATERADKESENDEYTAAQAQRMRDDAWSNYQAVLQQRDAEAAREVGEVQRFKSGHWDQPNVLVHLRVNDRTDAEGRKVLFVEEVQSDWGQQGKRQGFSKSQITGEVAQVGENEWRINWSDGSFSGGYWTRGEALGAMATRVQVKNANQVPSAPFVTDTKAWVALGVKRAIMMAVDGGYDAVAFVNGEQSADRYDLSKQVREISWRLYRGDKRSTVELTNGDQLVFHLTPDGRVDHVDGTGSTQYNGRGFDEVVGKEIAGKVIESEEGRLKGERLKIGGAGMKAFYDQILPSVTRDVLKKLGGGVVGSVDVAMDTRSFGQRNLEVNRFREEMLAKYGDGIAFKMTAEELGKMKRLEDGVSTQPGFQITDAMREKVRSGVPMFSLKQDQTQTPEFKRWFGDSKVVDANGEPLRVYHGTKSEFTEFRRTKSGEFGPAIYLTDSPREAGEYGDGKGWGGPSGTAIMPLYASIQNPYTKGVDAFWNEFGGNDSDANAIDRAQAAGYDGIIARRPDRYYDNTAREFVDRGNTLTHYVAFHPDQIKSAIGNRGTFDPTDPSIVAEPRPSDNRRKRKVDPNVQRQLDLFIDRGPDESQAGPAGERAQREAVAAVVDLHTSGSLLGLTLSRDYAARQRVNLLGQKVESAEDLATLAQVYRDPRFETLRLFFTDSAGKVVSQIGLTSRLPGSTAAIIGDNPDAYLKSVMNAAKTRGATAFWMLHNHPSGFADASRADQSLTALFAARTRANGLLEFKSHVIIDTNEYSTIDDEGIPTKIRKAFPQPEPMTADQFSGTAIQSPRDAMVLAKQLAIDPKAITLIVTDYQLRVRRVTEIPASVADLDSDKLRAAVAKVTLKSLGARVFAVGPDKSALLRFGGSVTDAIHVKERDGIRSATSLAEEFSSFRSSDILLESKRRTRFSPDTTSEFEALRAQTIPSARATSGLKVAEPDGVDPGNPDIRFSLSKKSFGDLNKSQEDALRNVGGIKTDQTIGERYAALRKDMGKRFAQGMVDQFRAIKDVDPLAYMHARLSKGSDGTLEATMLYGRPFLNQGVPDVKVNDTGFAKVLVSLKGEDSRFFWWVAAQRAERLKTLGLENLFSTQDIRSLKTLNTGNFADGSPRAAVYADALKQLNAFNDAVLELAEKSYLIDPKARAMFKDVPYVPFYRVMEEGIQGPTFSSGLTNQYAFKKLKGGDKKLNNDLLANTLLNWSHIISAAAKNRAAKATLDAAREIGAAVEADETTIRQMGKAANTRAVSYMQDGVKRWFLIEDPHLLEAISAIEYQTPNFFKPFELFKRALTVGVTASPTFKIRNLIRDTMSAIGTAELSYNPGKNIADGMRATAKDSQTRASMLAGGGLIRFGTMIEGDSAARARSLVKSQGGQILDEAAAKKLLGQVKSLWDAYQEIGDRFENVNRAALYQQLIDRGHTPVEANFMARDLLDFSMSGRWPLVRFLIATVPFMNARLQGLYKLGRASQEGDTWNVKGVQFSKRLGYVTGAVVMASLALMWAQEDDDDWKKRPDWDRDNFWWFKIGDTAFRIPKPFEIGAVGTLAERTWEVMFNPEMDTKRYRARLSNMIFQTFALDPTPQIFKPLLEVASNKDQFAQRPIETTSMRRLRPEDRATERTTEVAKFMGQIGLPNPAALIKGEYQAMSPVQFDHIIRGYGGWIGTSTAASIDWAVRPLLDRGERPAMQLREVFLAGSFMEKLPSNTSRYVDQLYNQTQEYQQAWASFMAAKKAGDEPRAQAIVKDVGMKGLMTGNIAERYIAAEGQYNQEIRRTEADKTMTSQAKRERIDALRQKQDELARQFIASTRR